LHSFLAALCFAAPTGEEAFPIFEIRRPELCNAPTLSSSFRGPTPGGLPRILQPYVGGFNPTPSDGFFCVSTGGDFVAFSPLSLCCLGTSGYVAKMTPPWANRSSFAMTGGDPRNWRLLMADRGTGGVYHLWDQRPPFSNGCQSPFFSSVPASIRDVASSFPFPL